MAKQLEISLDLEQESLFFEGYDYGGRLFPSDWEVLYALHIAEQPLPGEFIVKAGKNGSVKHRCREALRRLPAKMAAQLIVRDGDGYRLGNAVKCEDGANDSVSVDSCVPVDHYVKLMKGLKPPETHMEMVGPDLAREYLAKNVAGPDERANRVKRKGQIARGVRLIRSGAWKLTHQGIGFDTNDRLVDGQHRLESIIIAGITVPILVTRGLDPECYYGLDQGLRRTMGDILALDKRLSEPFRFLATLVLGRSQLSSEEVEPLVQTPLLQAGERLIAHCVTHRSSFTVSATRAAVMLAMVSRPQDEDYTLLLYSGLAKQSYNGLPEVAQTYNRQIEHAARGKRDQMGLMLRTLYMLDKNNAAVSMITISSEMVSRRARLIREWLRDYIANPNSKPADLLQQLGARQDASRKRQAQDATPLFEDADDLNDAGDPGHGKKSARR